MTGTDLLILAMAMLTLAMLTAGLGVALTYLDNAEEAENR